MFKRILSAIKKGMPPVMRQQPSLWTDRYIAYEKDLRMLASWDAFKDWEQIGNAHPSIVGMDLSHSLDVLLGYGDIELAKLFLNKAILKADRLWEEKLYESKCQEYMRPLYIGLTKRDELYAKLLLNKVWEGHEYDQAISKIEQWCFDKTENPYWSELTKHQALAGLRMSIFAERLDVANRFIRKLAKLSKIEETQLWLDVQNHNEALEKAILVKRYIGACPKAYNNEFNGTTLFQAELAMIILHLQGYNKEGMSLELLRQVVHAKT